MLRDRGEDAWERLTAFARTPLGDGPAAYLAIGWWLRIVCWVLVLVAALLLVGVVGAAVGYAGMLAMEPQGLLDGLFLAIATAAAFMLFLFALGAYMGATGLCFFVAFVYSAWVARQRKGLHGVRAIAAIVLALGAAGIGVGLSPFALALAVEILAAFGLVVLLATWLPSLTREFAPKAQG